MRIPANEHFAQEIRISGHPNQLCHLGFNAHGNAAFGEWMKFACNDVAFQSLFDTLDFFISTLFSNRCFNSRCSHLLIASINL